jgi:hypothetical protein
MERCETKRRSAARDTDYVGENEEAGAAQDFLSEGLCDSRCIV